MKNISIFYLKFFNFFFFFFLVVKFSIYLNRRVFVMILVVLTIIILFPCDINFTSIQKLSCHAIFNLSIVLEQMESVKILSQRYQLYLLTTSLIKSV